MRERQQRIYTKPHHTTRHHSNRTENKKKYVSMFWIASTTKRFYYNFNCSSCSNIESIALERGLKTGERYKQIFSLIVFLVTSLDEMTMTMAMEPSFYFRNRKYPLILERRHKTNDTNAQNTTTMSPKTKILTFSRSFLSSSVEIFFTKKKSLNVLFLVAFFFIRSNLFLIHSTQFTLFSSFFFLFFSRQSNFKVFSRILPFSCSHFVNHLKLVWQNWRNKFSEWNWIFFLSISLLVVYLHMIWIWSSLELTRFNFSNFWSWWSISKKIFHQRQKSKRMTEKKKTKMNKIIVKRWNFYWMNTNSCLNYGICQSELLNLLFSPFEFSTMRFSNFGFCVNVCCRERENEKCLRVEEKREKILWKARMIYT